MFVIFESGVRPTSSLSGVATSKANNLNKLERFVEKNSKSRKTSNQFGNMRTGMVAKIID